MHQIVYELHTLLAKAGERPPYVLVGHSFGGGLVRLYQSRYPADVVSLVLVEAAADNPWRKTPDKGLVRSSDLASGKPIPEVKTSDPLRYSEIPERFVTMIKDQVPQVSAHANDPPRDKLPADAQRMRTWSYAQVKMHISNDNPFEAEELGMLRAQRTRTAHVLGDLPLIVLSRGLPEDSSPAGQTGETESATRTSTMGRPLQRPRDWSRKIRSASSSAASRPWRKSASVIGTTRSGVTPAPSILFPLSVRMSTRLHWRRPPPLIDS